MGMPFALPCESCSQKAEAEWQAKLEQERLDGYRRRFEAEVPPLYRDNDTSRFPDAWQKFRDWKPENGRGLILVGDTGKCKTRMVAEIVKRLIFDGIRCRFLRASTFANVVRRQFSDQGGDEAREMLRNYQQVPVLVIDDIGKQASSPAIEEALFELVEFRIANLKSMIVTANATGKELEQMMSPDRGRPMVRRLREFCDAYTIN